MMRQRILLALLPAVASSLALADGQKIFLQECALCHGRGAVDDDRVWGRLVGVAVAHDGALIVGEDGNGALWRISHSRGQ